MARKVQRGPPWPSDEVKNARFASDILQKLTFFIVNDAAQQKINICISHETLCKNEGFGVPNSSKNERFGWSQARQNLRPA
jgi:hypothetical protein